MSEDRPRIPTSRSKLMPRFELDHRTQMLHSVNHNDIPPIPVEVEWRHQQELRQAMYGYGESAPWAKKLIGWLRS